MKLKSLKIVKGTVIIAFSVFATSCNNETGNNSTVETVSSDSTGAKGDTIKTTPANPTESSNTTATKKKKGKATVKMVADAGSKVEKDKMGYYSNTEVQPAYNGGQAALEDYVTNNIEYPQQAIDNSIEGTVSVHFLIDENGSVSNITTNGNKIGYGLEEEAVRVVSKMPKWTPGKVKGKNVKTWRTLPITYKLES